MAYHATVTALFMDIPFEEGLNTLVKSMAALIKKNDRGDLRIRIDWVS
jgi:hypothetical protein